MILDKRQTSDTCIVKLTLGLRSSRCLHDHLSQCSEKICYTQVWVLTDLFVLPIEFTDIKMEWWMQTGLENKMVEFGTQLFAYTKKFKTNGKSCSTLTSPLLKTLIQILTHFGLKLFKAIKCHLAASILYVPLFRITSAVDTANSFLITVRMMILENIWEFKQQQRQLKCHLKINISLNCLQNTLQMDW